jgi:hypothetical protein
MTLTEDPETEDILPRMGGEHVEDYTESRQRVYA